ncbi:MAG: hypothetical protein A2Y84_01360 [Candidatus Colwellbacteria bacterium RBG_13_48_8]|uniref:Serine aminopeptidase S33 domain-containing protein n=1 Tax=Candidatus Colwellbacteria bacterium RBG_13_48_8 TaxID=1797685 RepID=A0A1G1YWG0_9BACT|nr:MAG: hypothetical protein A2Y84_01360 [Candidatus Colwellbacteria bacterium RBG_13_48_8]
MEKLSIRNKNGQNLVVLLEKIDNSKGLVFIAHGLGGFKEQRHIEIFAEAFREKGFTVVRWDAANTIGESGGKMEDATVTSYYEDLEDVIEWAKIQDWYKEPFILTGHSLGGISTALYAENYPEKVKALAPISTVVSGKLTIEADEEHIPGVIKEWRKTGWQINESKSKPGVVKKLKWNQFEKDALKYDLLPKADQLAMPVLLIVGGEDWGTSPESHKLLYDKLPGQKEMHIIDGADHNFRTPDYDKNLQEIKQIFLSWINKYLS